jgi:hypothetical protein
VCLVYSDVVNCGNRQSFHEGWIMLLEAHIFISVLMQIIKLNKTKIIKNNICVGIICLPFLFSSLLTINLHLL